MLTTQEEAKGMQCPQCMFRKPFDKNGEWIDSHCYGAACMAWRWSKAWGPPWKGYCGLAGKPEDEGEA